MNAHDHILDRLTSYQGYLRGMFFHRERTAIFMNAENTLANSFHDIRCKSHDLFCTSIAGDNLSFIIEHHNAFAECMHHRAVSFLTDTHTLFGHLAIVDVHYGTDITQKSI